MKKSFYTEHGMYNDDGEAFQKELEFLFPLAEKYIKLDYSVAEIRDFVNKQMQLATVIPEIIHNAEKKENGNH